MHLTENYPNYIVFGIILIVKIHYFIKIIFKTIKRIKGLVFLVYKMFTINVCE